MCGLVPFIAPKNFNHEPLVGMLVLDIHNLLYQIWPIHKYILTNPYIWPEAFDWPKLLNPLGLLTQASLFWERNSTLAGWLAGWLAGYKIMGHFKIYYE